MVIYWRKWTVSSPNNPLFAYLWKKPYGYRVKSFSSITEQIVWFSMDIRCLDMNWSVIKLYLDILIIEHFVIEPLWYVFFYQIFVFWMFITKRSVLRYFCCYAIKHCYIALLTHTYTLNGSGKLSLILYDVTDKEFFQQGT